MELVYEEQARREQSSDSVSIQQLCRLIIIQSVANIAGSQPSQEALHPSSKFANPGELFHAIAPLAFQYNTTSIQSLLAVQLLSHHNNITSTGSLRWWLDIAFHASIRLS